METINLINLISDPSFENNGWSGANYSTSESLYGSRSLNFGVGTTVVATIPVARPILNHRYYGRRYIKTSGNNQPPDCRFEVYAGDGLGLNWVYAWNNGDHAEWEFSSIINEITVINYDETTQTNVRCFNVGTTAETWVDGLMLIDLTACFGSGNEPSKEWCDTNIPYFETTYQLLVTKKINITNASITPNPVDTDNLILISVNTSEELLLLTPEEKYSGEFYLAEV